MSNRLLNEVRKLINVKGPARAVLMTLADRANDNGECWPSHATIACGSGLGGSTVRKHLKILREQGYLTWKERTTSAGDKDSNLYRITLGGGGIPLSRRNTLSLAHDAPVGHEVADGGSQGSNKATMEPPCRIGKEAQCASNSAPIGTASMGPISQILTLDEGKTLALELYNKSKYNSEAVLAPFPSEEILEWTENWFLRVESDGGKYNGRKIQNPRANLEAWLRVCAGNQSKRFDELKESDGNDIESPF